MSIMQKRFMEKMHNPQGRKISTTSFSGDADNFTITPEIMYSLDEAERREKLFREKFDDIKISRYWNVMRASVHPDARFEDNDHLTLVFDINRASSLIARRSRRGRGNVVLTGAHLSIFKQVAAAKMYEIYSHPELPHDEALVIYVGSCMDGANFHLDESGLPVPYRKKGKPDELTGDLSEMIALVRFGWNEDPTDWPLVI